MQFLTIIGEGNYEKMQAYATNDDPTFDISFKPSRKRDFSFGVIYYARVTLNPTYAHALRSFQRIPETVVDNLFYDVKWRTSLDTIQEKKLRIERIEGPYSAEDLMDLPETEIPPR